MKISLSAGFRDKLQRQIHYISRDKPKAARKFKNDLFSRIREIPVMPYSYRKSVYFEDEQIRDLVFKGYIITFRINTEVNTIEVFGLSKFDLQP